MPTLGQLHEEEPRDHTGEAAVVAGDRVGLATAVGGGAPVAGEIPGRPFPGRTGLAGEAGLGSVAAATAVAALAGARPRSWSSPR